MNFLYAGDAYVRVNNNMPYLWKSILLSFFSFAFPSMYAACSIICFCSCRYKKHIHMSLNLQINGVMCVYVCACVCTYNARFFWRPLYTYTRPLTIFTRRTRFFSLSACAAGFLTYRVCMCVCGHPPRSPPRPKRFPPPFFSFPPFFTFALSLKLIHSMRNQTPQRTLGKYKFAHAPNSISHSAPTSPQLKSVSIFFIFCKKTNLCRRRILICVCASCVFFSVTFFTMCAWYGV